METNIPDIYAVGDCVRAGICCQGCQLLPNVQLQQMGRICGLILAADWEMSLKGYWELLLCDLI